MRNFLKIASGVAMGPLQQALWMNPQLWNAEDFRRTFPGTPHSEVDDIWLRYMPQGTDMLSGKETASQWYAASRVLDKIVAPLVLDIMRATNSYQLDRLLITRLAPGGRILPHADKGAEYTAIPGIARYHAVIQGLPGSVFSCGKEHVQMLTGDVWWFNALEVHKCYNGSAGDRIHLLIDCRVWP